jgi:hypothetical protein
MATTPNYGWVMPDPTDFVTDLPADFEIFGDAVDTTLEAIETKLDVITTEGDLIVGDASGDPVRVPIGTAGQVLASDGDTVEWADPASSGLTWTLRAAPRELFGGAINFNYVGYSNSLWFVAGGSGEVGYSSDGISWTVVDIGSSGTVNKVAWVSFVNLYLAILSNGNLYTSPDLITWTSRTSGFSTSSINDFEDNGSIIVFVGAGGQVRTSTNGTSTTGRTGNMSTNEIIRVKWGAADSIFVAMTQAVGGANAAAYSTDGITWTAITTSGDQKRDLFYKDGYFFAPSVTDVIWSADGITWSLNSDIEFQVDTNSFTRSLAGWNTNQIMVLTQIKSGNVGNHIALIDFTGIGSAASPSWIYLAPAPIPNFQNASDWNLLMVATNGSQIMIASAAGQIMTNF